MNEEIKDLLKNIDGRLEAIVQLQKIIDWLDQCNQKDYNRIGEIGAGR